MTSTARAAALDTNGDEATRPIAHAHRFAAAAVGITVLLLELGGALVRRDWLLEVAFGWSVVFGGLALVLGLLLGGHLSDRIGPRAVFSISATVAMATLGLSIALPAGAAATSFMAFAATASTTISGLMALVRSTPRPALAIATVLGAETLLALLNPSSFGSVIGTERPGVMIAGILLASIAAVWVTIRSLPLDEPTRSLPPNALYDARDLEILGRARLLGTAGFASVAIVIGERVSGASEPGPSATAIIVALALLAAALLVMRTRLLSAIDLRSPFQPALIAAVSMAIILGFGVGLHDVVARIASVGIDARLATLVPLAGYGLAAMAIDVGRARHTSIAITAIVAVAGVHAVLMGIGLIDAPTLGGLIPIATTGAAAALVVFALSEVAIRAPSAIAGVTMAITLTALSYGEALGRAANSPTDAGVALLGGEFLLDGQTQMIAGLGALACVAASVIVWLRSSDA